MGHDLQVKTNSLGYYLHPRTSSKATTKDWPPRFSFSNNTMTYDQRAKLLPVGVRSDLQPSAQFFRQLLGAGPRHRGGRRRGQSQAEGISRHVHFLWNGFPRLWRNQTLRLVLGTGDLPVFLLIEHTTFITIRVTIINNYLACGTKSSR